MTTDELIKLTEFCGKQAYWPMCGTEVHLTTDGTRRIGNQKWQPHIDANQRDEVVEALRKAGWGIVICAWSDCYMAYGSNRERLCPRCGKQRCCTTPDNECDTPGDAVCAAAIQAIEHMEGKSND